MKYEITITTDTLDRDAIEELFPDSDVTVEQIPETPEEAADLAEIEAERELDRRRERHFDRHGHF